MAKIKYSREELLNLRAQAPKEKPSGMPEEFCISNYGKVATLFNGRTGTSCRPPVEKNKFNDDLNPGSPPVACC